MFLFFSRRKAGDEAFDIIRELILDQQAHSRAELKRHCSRRGIGDEVFDNCIDGLVRDGVLHADDQGRIRYVAVG